MPWRSITGGGYSPYSTVPDTVRCHIVERSRKHWSSYEVAPTPLSIKVVAEPASVNAGQASIITATVTGDFNVGVTVTFSLPLNNSGASLSASSAVTDGSGNAVVTYMAGSNSPSLTVDDTVRAAVGSMSSSVVITRTTGEITAGAVLTLSASPTSVNGGQTTTITAMVTGGTSAGANETVTLTIPVNSSSGSFVNASGASVSTVTLTTGSAGTATAVYKAGTNTPGIAVQDTVQGVVTSSSAIGAVMITRNAGFSGYIVTVTADPASVVQSGVSRITANVKDNTGAAVVGRTVNFAVTGAGAVSPAAATTDGAGNAVTSFTAPGAGAPTSSTVTATVIDRQCHLYRFRRHSNDTIKGGPFRSIHPSTLPRPGEGGRFSCGASPSRASPPEPGTHPRFFALDTLLRRMLAFLPTAVGRAEFRKPLKRR